MDEPSARDVAFSILFYTASSGAMLVSNKVAITCMLLPGVLFCIQLSSAVSYIYFFKCIGVLDVDSFQKDNVLKFMPYIVFFCNLCVLQWKNIGAFKC